ncbi:MULTISPECIES: ATP-dependent protease subunit HslV [Lacticaseibacillus]|jgi:ATP-dependent HslUV protease subunit HslV|uniref:ATP-dependent protease subunit HslV n=3 Tax=Lacticaseibacillus TaxID=2759736 RepID=A0ABY9L6Y3_9LACO|nr:MULTISPECIES: ATP-dependent protease subunit HslV [Lacticaseibacillus]HAJ54321.1 HslU--HslV peptidase proteolytic subunit [Lactobacillus sp.]MBI6598358.1 ATP-dependent protease subunit HslV [Lacticaseibacillus casei]MBO1481976.1 ATP-dependent protease subunit HslV [Lacticaseibacillus casei]MBO2417259.1 ATP-dependent protease subunit HslV [Lacticaseibacillus casei]MCK2081652.1 ATP-dependent protease subunit HslV [Lacticaseibacillus casei]
MTTIAAVRKDGVTALAGDGQVTLGEKVIMKGNAQKVRRIYHDQVVIGFAGGVADAFTLQDWFEKKLEHYAGNLRRSAVALAQDWRKDPTLQKLEAMMIVMDEHDLLLVSGSGEVIDPDEDVVAIGSGGNFAQAAAIAMLRHAPDMTPADIAKEAVNIAGNIDIFTNHNIIVESF